MTARVITALLMLTAGTVSAVASSALSPEDIKVTFGNGKQFTAANRGGGKEYWFTFNADGTAVQVPKEKGRKTIGKWDLSAKGYCTQWGSSRAHCYTVDKNGAHYEVRDAAGTLVSIWTPATPTAAPSPLVRMAAVPLAKATLPMGTAVARATGGYADGTYAGPVENAYYGLVQIQAVIQNRRLTDAKVLQFPSDRRTSVAINRRALPMLRDEVISAQSAHVDVVSGATLTSDAFIQSLAAALKDATP